MNVINRLICFKFYKCSNIKIINNFAWANKITDCNDAINNNVIYAADGFAKIARQPTQHILQFGLMLGIQITLLNLLLLLAHR